MPEAAILMATKLADPKARKGRREHGVIGRASDKAMFLPMLSIACALASDGETPPRPRGIDAPADAAALITASLPVLAMLAQPPSTSLAAILGDARDVEEMLAPGIPPPTPPPTPLPVLTPSRVLVTGDGPLAFTVHFYDQQRDEHVSLVWGRRLAPPAKSAPDVLVLLLTPVVEPGPLVPRGNDAAFWFTATPTKSGPPRFLPAPPTEAEKSNPLSGFGKPFSPCVRTLQHAADNIGIAAVLKTDEDFRYLPEVERLAVEVYDGVTFVVKLTRDRRAFSADIRYRDGLARLKPGATEATIVKACRRGR